MDSRKGNKCITFRATHEERSFWARRIKEEKGKGVEVSISSIRRAALRKALGKIDR